MGRIKAEKCRTTDYSVKSGFSLEKESWGYAVKMPFSKLWQNSP